LVTDGGAVRVGQVAGRVDRVASIGVGPHRGVAHALGLRAETDRGAELARDILPGRIVGEAAADGSAAIVALGAGVVADGDRVGTVGFGVGPDRHAQLVVDHGVVAAVVRAGRLEVARSRGRRLAGDFVEL